MNNMLIIIDGNSLMNRAFYALPDLMNKKGLHTNAIYGFANILLKIKEQYNPSHMSIAFDMKAPTFRHIQYSDYKGTRKGMPDELRVQVEPLKEMIDAFGISRLEIEGYEADDIIGTVAREGEKQGFEVIIITGDRDALQLATDKVKIFFTKKGISELEEYDYDKMIETYEITPTQFIDLKALMGDKSDNIPGVAGIGEKTGIKLIKEFGSIENLYENIDKVTGNTKKKLEDGYEDALLSKSLATIVTDIPIEFTLSEFLMHPIEVQKLSALFNEWEFTSLIARIMKEHQEKESTSQEDSIINIITGDTVKLWKHKQLENKEMILKVVAKEGHVGEKKIIGIYSKLEDQYYFIPENMIDELGSILEDEKVKKIGYKIKEDYLNLKEYDIEMKGITSDLIIADYLLDSNSSNYEIQTIGIKYNLGSIAAEENFLGKGKSKKIMSEIDTSERDQYFASMLDIIEKGTKLLSQRIEDEEMKDLYQDIEIPLITVLGDMEYNGIAVDKSILDKLKIQFEKEISALQAEIYDLAQEEFNISSPKQLGVILFEKLSLPAIKKTKTGYSTNAEVLEYLMDKHPIIEKILQYRQFTKLQSTYVEGLLKIINPITGRIHSNFNQTIAATGRISSTDPNLQNIPVRLEIGRELRKVFVSKKGSLLVDADYSQIELRVLASMSSDEDMIDAFSGDTDIHTSTASEVFGVPVDQVTKSQRGAAKAVNFGIVYGISDFGLANNLGIDLKTAKDYIETYLSRYPGIKKYMDDIIKFGEEKGYVVTLLGRRRYIPELQAKNFVVKNLGKRLAMNTPIQGSAADIIKIAMVKVHKRLQEEQLNSRLVLQVHDELLIEADEKEVTIIRGLIAEEMENAVHMKVKLSVDVESGKSWYDTK